MLRILYAYDDELGCVTASIIPDSEEERDKVARLLRNVIIGNPIVHKVKHKGRIKKKQEVEKAIENCNSKVFANGNTTLTVSNPLFLLENALDSMVENEAENDAIKRRMREDKEYSVKNEPTFAPHYTFPDEFEDEFTFSVSPNNDRCGFLKLRSLKINFETGVWLGAIDDYEDDFMYLISNGKTEMNMMEFLAHLVGTIWKYYSSNSKRED